MHEGYEQVVKRTSSVVESSDLSSSITLGGSQNMERYDEEVTHFALPADRLLGHSHLLDFSQPPNMKEIHTAHTLRILSTSCFIRVYSACASGPVYIGSSSSSVDSLGVAAFLELLWGASRERERSLRFDLAFCAMLDRLPSCTIFVTMSLSSSSIHTEAFGRGFALTRPLSPDSSWTDVRTRAMFAAFDEDVPPPLACEERFFLRRTISSCGGASSIARASGERDLRRRVDPGPAGTRALFSRCRIEPVERRLEELVF